MQPVAQRGRGGCALTGPRIRALKSYLAYLWARGPSRLFRIGRPGLVWERAQARRAVRAWASQQRCPELTVCVPTRCRIDLLLPCLRSLAATADGWPVDVVVAETGRAPTAEVLERQLGVRALSVSGPFNFAEACNRMADAARGRRLIFLNDDTIARTTGWPRALIGADEDEVIGALLLYPGSDRVQHSGVEAGIGVASARRNRYGPRGFTSRSNGLVLRTIGLGRPASELAGSPDLEVLAVSGAALSVDAERFRSAGGFDPGYAVDLQDFDLCLRLREQGARVVCRTDVVFSHRGAGTRGFYAFPQEDWERFVGRWGNQLKDSSELAVAAAERCSSTRPPSRLRSRPS